MENRLRKLQNEQERLNRQIAIANKHSKFADDVLERRTQQNSDWASHLNMIENNRQVQAQVNNMRKVDNETTIKKQMDSVQKANFESRFVVGVNTKDHNDTISKFRSQDLNNK